MSLTLGYIVKLLGGELIGDSDYLIYGLNTIDMASNEDLSFLSNSKYKKQLSTSRAACIIVEPNMRDIAVKRGPCIVADNPYFYFSQVTQLWKKQLQKSPISKIHSSAVIDADSSIHISVEIGPLCVVERGVSIGANTILKSHVTVGENCSVGERCILHSGVVIGADGFGFAQHDGSWSKIEQLGSVCIGNDVEIGANTCVDRGALQDTIICDGVKLDNLIQIGHNVKIGAHTALAGCVGVAGSANIGARCTIGGGAIILGHLSLADNVHISAATVVTRSIHKPGNYTGIFPIDENKVWEKNAVSVKQLYKLRERIRELENKIQKNI